jgi:hypothetical protein
MALACLFFVDVLSLRLRQTIARPGYDLTSRIRQSHTALKEATALRTGSLECYPYLWKKESDVGCRIAGVDCEIPGNCSLSNREIYARKSTNDKYYSKG